MVTKQQGRRLAFGPSRLVIGCVCRSAVSAPRRRGWRDVPGPGRCRLSAPERESGSARGTLWRWLPWRQDLNGDAFTAAPAGRQGNFGRNVLRGFDASQADLGVQRIFGITEKAGLRFRAEFFNLLNHPNFGSPTNSLPNALFGRSRQTLANALGSGGANGGFNPIYQIGGPGQSSWR